MTFIGIDNGVSGTIGVIRQPFDKKSWATLNVFAYKEFDYNKTKKKITRIDFEATCNFLKLQKDPYAVIERPFKNPMMFTASISSCRSFEALSIALHVCKIPFEVIDSRRWQKELLPAGLKGPELKTASLQVGERLFPGASVMLKGAKDLDGLLIAWWAFNNRSGMN